MSYSPYLEAETDGGTLPAIGHLLFPSVITMTVGSALNLSPSKMRSYS
jgi:hypothetical protein